MKLKTADLIGRIEQRIAALTAEHLEKHEDHEAKYFADATEWQNVKAPQLADVLQSLADRARRGEPVTFQEVRNLLNDGDNWSRSQSATVLCYSGTTKPDPYVHPTFVAYDGLLAFLRATDDEFVTTDNLQRFGWRDLSKVFAS